MVLSCLAALLLALLVSAGFGKPFVAWLEKKNARQPLKEEVARLYTEADAPGADAADHHNTHAR